MTLEPPLEAVEAGTVSGLRPAWAEIDLEAVRHNARLLADRVAPAGLCAVVKAWGYGHGAGPVARAAIDGGATWLAVALVEEGSQLRVEGITAPILLLSEPPPGAMAEVVRSRLTPTIYTTEGLEAVVSEVAAHGMNEPFQVHVKVDTGMHRVGATPDDAVTLARRVAEQPSLALDGVWTHLAVADQIQSPDTDDQLARFRSTLDRLAEQGIRPRLAHAANSAGALFHPDSRFDMVRCGISLYGLAPASGLAADPVCAALKPAMALRARVSFVKEVGAGERLSYGLLYRAPVRTVVATVPLGYADGVSRALSSTGGQVLIGGRRLPIAGTVTMDQILVDCGPGTNVAAGDSVVLLGRQGSEEITAWEWADRVGTISYEVVCGVGPRVPRVYLP